MRWIQAEVPSSTVLKLSNPVEAGKSNPAAVLTAHGSFESPEGIAVDNSCALEKLTEPACKGKDPSNGDVYVVDEGEANPENHRAIVKYSPSGEYLGQISEGAEGRLFIKLDGVAIGAGGAVFVPQRLGRINEYTNEAFNKFTTSVQVTELPNFGEPGFATDAKGNFYFANGPANKVVTQADPNGKVLKPEFDPGNASAVATDLVTNLIFIDDRTSVAVRDSESAELLERVGEEGGVKHLTQGAGLAVNAGAGAGEGAGDLYVADAAEDRVALFVPAEPSAPSIEGESLPEVASDSAILAAKINPQSETGETATEYDFQYGRCATATSCRESGWDATTPAGLIAAGFEGQEVSAKAGSLQAGVTYHFRVRARNGHSHEGEYTLGDERTFTTEGAGGPLVLPDNRGWELVSPPDKRGSLIQPISESGVSQAAADGSAITYLANAPTEASPQGDSNAVQVLSRRTGMAWSSSDIAIPHAGTTGGSVGHGTEYRFFDTELTLSVVQPFGEFNPALSEEASEQTAYLRSLSEGCANHCYRPLVTGKAPFANVEEAIHFGEAQECQPKVQESQHLICGPKFLGASDDLAHIMLGSNTALRTGGQAGLYEWSAGALTPVSVLPGGEEETKAELGRNESAPQGAISPDGTKVVFSTPVPKALYERDTARPGTVQLDKAEEVKGEPCEECESGGGVFQFTRAAGARVFFTDTHKLTKDSGAVTNKKADLYECKVALHEGHLSCELHDLTPARGKEGAEVRGSLLGGSEDGSLIYLVANGVLTEEANERKAKAIAGQANLYLLDESQPRFIATLAKGDAFDWNETASSQPTRVSKSGRFLELMSEASPTGYDNRDIKTERPVAEVYLYDASTNHLSCASCEPSGARAVGVEAKTLQPEEGGLTGGPRQVWPSSALVAANVPGWTVFSVETSHYQPRYLSDEGRLFFNSIDALVPQDTNSTQDVYEYEPPGVGSCTQASETYSARSGGCVRLISSGISAQESAFLDASETGDDVFFLTAAKLSPLDTDTALDVYDAHVCTGSSPCITFPEVQSPPCTNESSCKASPTPQPSIFGAPASATFQGLGNLTPTPPPPTKLKTAEQIRLEKLSKALKVCRTKHNKHKRQACERAARKKYAKASARRSSHTATLNDQKRTR